MATTPISSSPSTNVHIDPENVLDLVGIGLGPSHLALAVAFKEDCPRGRALFLDQRDSFAWHPALLLPASRMQISFMKDLATFRNPQSSFTFVSYLHEVGRLVAFTNLGVWTPSRLEWATYLAWAAQKLENDGFVQWSSRVEAIEPIVSESGQVLLFKITLRDVLRKTSNMLYSRNVSVAPGSTPNIPPLFASAPGSAPISHTSSYLTTLAKHVPSPQTFTGRIAVIGGGQSSAEVFNDLRDRCPLARVDLIFRASALVPADDSAFVNAKAFDPAMTDEFFGLQENERVSRLREFRRTNYACVAPELIDSMFKLLYTQDLKGGEPQYRLLPNSGVTAVHVVQASNNTFGGAVRLTVSPNLSTGTPPKEETYDLVFLGTGYHRPNASLSFMSRLAPSFPALERYLSGKADALQVGRDYAIAHAENGGGNEMEQARLFVLGFSEKTHGLSETLLSIGAIRAGEVVRALAHGDDDMGVSRGRLLTGTLTPESDRSPVHKQAPLNPELNSPLARTAIGAWFLRMRAKRLREKGVHN